MKHPFPRLLTCVLTLMLTLSLLSGCQFSLGGLLRKASVSPPPEDYVGQEDGFRYAKTTLSGQERYLYDQLLRGLQNHETEIGGLYPDAEMIQAAIDAIDRDYPELFWFSGTGQIETTLLADTPLKASYLPVYTMDQNQQESTQVQIDHWAKECFATLPQDGTDYDKALGIYTYLIDHADYQVVPSNSIVNIMVNGAGLCGCYAKTFQYLCSQQGIDVTYVTGQAGGEAHAWNLAWLDGTPCWIDPTWGDPVFTGGNNSQGPSYEYFGLTTADLERTHTFRGDISMPDCTDHRCNYFVRQGLFFSSYDQNALVSVFQRALSENASQISIRFTPQAYQSACHALLTQRQLYAVFRQANPKVSLPANSTLKYTKNDDMCVLTFFVPS